MTSTSSQICGSWYLPIFLLRDGSLTLISIASLIALVKLWSFLPTMLKLSRDTSWPVVLWWSWMGDGDFMCSLNHSAKVLPDSPMHSSSQSTLPHLYLYITPLFFSMLSLSFGWTRSCLMMLAPLKCISMPCLLQMFLLLSLKSLHIGHYYVWFLVTVCDVYRLGLSFAIFHGIHIGPI